MTTHWTKPVLAALAAMMFPVVGGCDADSSDLGRADALRRSVLQSNVEVTQPEGDERGLLCQPCPAGDVTLTDGEGDFGGWCAHVSEAANVQVSVVDVDLAASKAVVSLELDYTRPPSGLTGLFRPLLIDFIQVCDDAQTVTMIEIAQENISNQTGADWNVFDWVLFRSGDLSIATFDVVASGGFDVSPFTSSTFSDFADAPANQQALRLQAASGVVASGGSFAPGAGATPADGGILKINVSLSSDNAVSWALKQLPGHVAPLADLDGDGDVDGVDFGVLSGCLTGPGRSPSPTCQPADLDRDGDVDLTDVSQFNSLAGNP